MEISQSLIFTSSTIICVILLSWLIKYIKRCKALPPGPWGLPVVGYLPWMEKQPIKAFAKIAKTYGNIFSVNLGNETVVVLNDWDSIKASLVTQPKAFIGRPYSFVFHSLTQGKDIGSNDGPVWRAQRNLTTHILRNLGMGKKSMESRAMDMVHEIINTLNQAEGKVQCMKSILFRPLLRVNWNLVSAGCDEEHASEIKEMEEIFVNMYEALSVDNPVNTFPWLRFIPPNGFGYWRHMRKNKLFFSFLNKIVDEHVAEWKEGKLDDFIDYYLSEIKKQKANNGIEKIPFNVDYISFTLFDLFLAGVDTTNGTSLWGFLHLALNPSVQKKAQDELDEVVGRHRLPNISDMPRLPYFEALMMEVHRIGSSVPFSVPHKTMETVNLIDYTIPKGTTVVQNIHGVHRHPKLWDEPEVFKPERFLTANNKPKAPPYLMPFSIGPRICLGQSLAEMELNLIFSCLLHQFTFSLPHDQPLPTLEPVVRFTTKPHPYSLHIRKRKD